MAFTGYELAFLFFVYSFLGWVMETTVATIRGRSFANRGFMALPLCAVYGAAGVLLAVTMGELKESPGFLFLGCALVCTCLEWVSAKLLERLGGRRWWDYSSRRLHLDGYVCLTYSLLWGVLGGCAVYWWNGWLCDLFRLLPLTVGKLLIWCLIPLSLLDGFVSLTALTRRGKSPVWMERTARRMRGFTLRLGGRISRRLERRLEKAYPAPQRAEEATEQDAPLTPGKLLWVFVIGSLLGDLTETLFCRVTAGVWMSRSSLVWGPFSVVWGFALVLATVLLHRNRSRSAVAIFGVGTLLGGAYEYICSVLGELVFGAVFWDYSDYPLNLGGRVNLLYCLFWGVAAVLWIKAVYPPFSRLVDRLRAKTGRGFTLVLAVFMSVNCLVSVAALARYEERTQGASAQSALEELLDERFDDERMGRIYPNLKHTQ